MKNTRLKAHDKITGKEMEVIEIVWECVWCPKRIGVIIKDKEGFCWSRDFEDVEIQYQDEIIARLRKENIELAMRLNKKDEELEQVKKRVQEVFMETKNTGFEEAK